MNTKILEMLDKEIETIINTMEDLAIDSVEYKQAAEILTKLTEKRNDIMKIEYDHLDKKQSRHEENDLKLRQMDDEKKDRRVKNGLMAVKIVSGIVITVVGTYVTLNFERINNVTTLSGREFAKRLFAPLKD